METKICSKCRNKKEYSNFYKHKNNKDGYWYHCKSCQKEINKKLRENDEFLLREKEYNYKRNSKEEIIKLRKEYQLWYNKLPYVREKLNKKFKEDIIFKFSILLRNHLNRTIRNNIKYNSILDIIGITLEDFKIYIESKFVLGMTWNNWGEIWELDHIIGCCNFDLSKQQEQQKCFHYTNYQPLFKTTKIAESFGYKNYIGNRNKSKRI